MGIDLGRGLDLLLSPVCLFNHIFNRRLAVTAAAVDAEAYLRVLARGAVEYIDGALGMGSLTRISLAAVSPSLR